MSRRTLKPQTAQKRDPKLATTEVTLTRKTPSERLRAAKVPLRFDTALCGRVLRLIEDGNVVIAVHQTVDALQRTFEASVTLHRGCRDRVVKGRGPSSLAAVQDVLDRLDG